MEGCFAQTYKPTLWKRLGFGHCSAPVMDEEDYPQLAPGALSLDTYLHFDWKDRIRLLISGNAMVSVRCKTNVIIDHAVSLSRTSVLPPGDLRQ